MKLDEKGFLEKRVWRRGSFSKFQVGKKEKHEVELKLTGIFPKIRCFVDGRFFLGRMIPPLGDAISILLLTVVFVGLFSGLAGSLMMHSNMCKISADHCDDIGLYSDATDMRNVATESHDYGIYCAVGAVLCAVGGAGWMAWSFREREG